jgi:hypothetical protein
MKQQKKSPQQRASLRVCASCEWIFKGNIECPKCGFGSYGARHVYGDKCYKYSVSQLPWVDKQMDNHLSKLLQEVKQTNPIKGPHVKSPFGWKL